MPAWEAAQEKGPNNRCSAHKSAGRGSRVGLQGAGMPRWVPCAPQVQGVLGAVAGSEARPGERARLVQAVPGPLQEPGQGREVQVEEPDPHGVVSGEQVQAQTPSAAARGESPGEGEAEGAVPCQKECRGVGVGVDTGRRVEVRSAAGHTTGQHPRGRVLPGLLGHWLPGDPHHAQSSPGDETAGPPVFTLNLSGVGDSHSTRATVRYKVPLLDLGRRVILVTAHGIKRIISPLKEDDLAPMKEALPEVPTGGLVTAAGEESRLMGQDNLFPSEKRRVSDAALYGSRFGTGFIASGRPPQAKGGRGDRHTEVCTAMQPEHERKELAGHPELPSGPPESPACDDMQTVMAGMTLAQTVGEQGKAEACETPLPWEEETLTTCRRSKKTAGWEQLLEVSDLDDDPFDDRRSLQHSYRSTTPVADCHRYQRHRWQIATGVNNTGVK